MDYYSTDTANASVAASTAASVYYDTDAFRTIGVSIGIFDIIVGSIGNLMTILAIIGNKKLHKPFHIFIANLCFIDFLTASSMMPFNVAAYYTQTWPFGEDDFTCTFMAFCYYCCGYSSIVCLLVITTNRFVGVVYPDSYVRLFSKTRIMIVIVISWIFAPIFLSPVFSFTSGGYGWNKKQTLCVFLKQDYNEAEVNYMQFIRVLFQFLPLLVMVVLYAKIFFTARQSGRTVTRLTTLSHSTPRLNRAGAYIDDANNTSLLMRTSSRQQRFGRNQANSSLQSIPHDKENNALERNFSKTAADSSSSTDDLSTCYDSNKDIRINGLQEESKLLKKSDPYLQRNDDSMNSIESGQRGLNKLSSLRARIHLKEKKSASVPATPILGVKNPVNSAVSCQSFRGVKSCPSPVSRSRCSSKSGKYGNSIQQEARKRKRLDRRLLRISLTICTTFMILFLPSVIVNIAGVSDPRYHMFASFITWLNSCVNPIVYNFMNANMRKQYKLLLIKFWNMTFRCLKIKDTDLTSTIHRPIGSSTSFRSSRKT